MTSIDKQIFELLRPLVGKSSLLDILLVFLAKYIVWILIIWVILYILNKKDWSNNLSNWKNRFQYIALGVLGVTLSRGIFANTIARIVDSPRPFVYFGFDPLVNHAAVNSFPSGHMTTLVPVVLTLWLLNKKAGIWAMLATILVGVARIVVGLHWPTDILVGIVIGVLSFVVVKKLFDRKKLFLSQVPGA